MIFRSLSGVIDEAYRTVAEIEAKNSGEIREITIPPIIPAAVESCGARGRFRIVGVNFEKLIWPKKPNSAPQQEFIGDVAAKYCAFAGGWGSGKSWAGARKFLSLHCANAVADDGSLTGVAGLIVSQNYSTASTVNIPQIRQAAEEMGLSVNFVSDIRRHYFVVDDFSTPDQPSLIFVRSAETPASIAGFEVGHVWCDEAARFYKSELDPLQDAIVQADGRMRSKRARILQMMFTYTNEGDETTVFERFETNPTADHKLYRGKTSDNSANNEDYVRRLRSSLSAELAKQYLDGGVASLRGAPIYYNFSAERNLIDTPALDQRLPLALMFDFNVDPGSHAILCQWDLEARKLVAVREFFGERMLARRLTETIVFWMTENFSGLPVVNPSPMHGWKFPGTLLLFGDASGMRRGFLEADGAASWDEIQSVFALNGVPYDLRSVPSANPPVSERVACVNSAFGAADGTVSLLVARNCHRLIRDFSQLRWAGNTEDKRDKRISHASSALGYGVFQLLPIR
jgi:hypothetical protein